MNGLREYLAGHNDGPGGMSMDSDELIQPGDVFVKQWGSTEMIHLFVMGNGRQRTSPYMRLHAFSVDTTYVSHRSELTGRRGYRYVGRIPSEWMSYVRRNWTMR